MHERARSLPRRLIGFAVALVFAGPAIGAVPVVDVAPLTPTTLTLTPHDEAFVRYQVTNQSSVTRTLAMRPIVGIEIATAVGDCADPFTLAAHASCVLDLHVIGSQMVGDIIGGPVVCNSGNALQCYQPAAAGQLHVTLVPVPTAVIEASPATLAIAVGSVAAITVSNAADSPVSAQNLSVAVPPASSIVVDPGNCAAALPPGASCTLQVGGSVPESATVLVIAGDDTTSASVAVTLFDDAIFADGFDA